MKSKTSLLTNHISFILIICNGRNQTEHNKQVYETNFGTAYQTYKDAIKRNPSIRLQDVT